MVDFDSRARELADMVGSGPLVGRVEVNQRYAEVQERSADFRHPNGGQYDYLGSSLFDTARDNLQGIADELLDRGPVPPMSDAVERIASQVSRRAPVDHFYLRHSAHPTVTDGPETVYDRPPIQRRLTDEELAAISRATLGRRRG